MPLVILCGYPASGKTFRAKQLAEHYSDKNCVLVNEESLGISKKLAYSSRPFSTFSGTHLTGDSFEEKRIRGQLISAVERHLSPTTVVIVDSLNYIKGFRYQLYCIARAMGTNHCVIHVSTPVELLAKLNDRRLNEEDRFDTKQITELVDRFEEPDGRQKWDQPFFFIPHSDEALPFREIDQSLFEKNVPPPNLSTVVKPATETSYLQMLDKQTQETVNEVLNASNMNQSTCSLKNGLKICLANRPSISPAELQRHRKQFIHLNKFHTLPNEKIPTAFAEYLNVVLNQ